MDTATITDTEKAARDAGTVGEVQERVVACRACPRLVEWREETARVKRRMYRDEDYWGRPLAAFGDPNARLLIVGLAPAAHGGNRTGRMFTGDRSGDWLFGALHRAGFANQPESTRPGDGLELRGALITAAARCAPPQNKLTPGELSACRPYITREIELLTDLRAVVALGRIAFDAFLRAWAAAGRTPPERKPPFGHDVATPLPDGGPLLIACYHPSQQNTQTGRLTETMLDDVFTRARAAVQQL
ncbi:MAG: uracil-DNA glycosylase [Dehalococcoidia bacterium]|nr:uracil-DNA glycosylase [Dehalococcoidia bacterium]